jgi:hypothetical protein
MGQEDTVISEDAGSSSDNVAKSPKENGVTTIVDEESGRKTKLRNDLDARQEFLATFSAKESRAIMSKVDRRFFLLIGFMFMVKNVSVSLLLKSDGLALINRCLLTICSPNRWITPTQATSKFSMLASRPTF